MLYKISVGERECHGIERGKIPEGCRRWMVLPARVVSIVITCNGNGSLSFQDQVIP